MYVIIVYDIAQERVSKACSLLRRYLNWIQNSVFEGEVSESGLHKIKQEIKKVVKESEDSVIFYVTTSKKIVEREVLGIEKNDTSNLI
ncbi:MAG: CRISPR-associated endonuclease Cas2 [Candidatus Aenigmarchaeota archaeon]|nr:CRISPR-associated endonuclease Cas2 [Candidatus Aenigmarchaeota archaeon]